MKTEQPTPKNIDEYIGGFPSDVREILEEIRTMIGKAAPEAEEKVSYRIPTLTLNGRYLVYFAAYRKHVGLYPVPVGNAEFDEELAVYRAGKGTARFLLDKPIPFELITRIVKFRVNETLAQAANKGRKKQAAEGSTSGEGQ